MLYEIFNLFDIILSLNEVLEEDLYLLLSRFLNSIVVLMIFHIISLIF